MRLLETVRSSFLQANALAVLLLCAFSGCEREVAEVDVDPVVMTVGASSIRVSELQAQLDYWRESGSVLPADRDVFFEDYTQRMVALEKARSLGLDQDPELRSQWEGLLLGRLRSVELQAKLQQVSITPEAVEAHYQATLADYTKPAQRRLALLYLPVSAHAQEGARAATNARLEEARTLAAQLPEGTRGFGSLAVKFSEEGTSRFKGGDTGWIEAGKERYRWPEAVVNAVFELQENGDLSSVIEAEDGSYLLMRLDGRPESVRSLDDGLSQKIYNQLLLKEKDALTASISESWSDGISVEINQQALSQLQFDADREPIAPVAAEYSSIPLSK